METFEKTLITLASLHSYTHTCLQVYNLYRLHRPILFRFLVGLTYILVVLTISVKRNLRLHTLMYTPNIFGYKAIHTFVYNTVVPILLSTLHSLSYTTLVQFGETFLSVLLLKFCTSSHCRAYFSSVNTLSKIWSP